MAIERDPIVHGSTKHHYREGVDMTEDQSSINAREMDQLTRQLWTMEMALDHLRVLVELRPDKHICIMKGDHVKALIEIVGMVQAKEWELEQRIEELKKEMDSE